MAKINLDRLSLSELQQLQKDVAKKIESHSREKKAAARKAIEKVARQHGLTLAEIIEAPVKRRGPAKKQKTEPKYRNPEDASQTWSGRGRQPAWYKSAIEAGKSPESMAIQTT